MTVRSQFTDRELAAIRSATREAEERTGGELVCVIVNRCDSYQAPAWQATALGALAGALIAGIWYQYCGLWPFEPLFWILLPPFAGAALGLLAVGLLPFLRRWSIPPTLLARRVDQRAAAAFLAEEVFSTRDRTGLLLFVALFERQVRILPDQGVADQVPEVEWQRIVDPLTSELRRGRRRGDAIVEAIRVCGRVLASHGVARHVDDENELEDEPRLLDD